MWQWSLTSEYECNDQKKKRLQNWYDGNDSDYGYENMNHCSDGDEVHNADDTDELPYFQN